MKKSIMISVTLVVFAGFVAQFVMSEKVNSVLSFKPQPSSEQKTAQEMTTAPNSANQGLIIVDKTDQIEQLIKEVPTIQEFDREYRNFKVSELQKALEESRKAIADGNLIEKSNQGALASQEIQTLVTEMRRQGVLSKYLNKDRIERLKKEYL